MPGTYDMDKHLRPKHGGKAHSRSGCTWGRRIQSLHPAEKAWVSQTKLSKAGRGDGVYSRWNHKPFEIPEHAKPKPYRVPRWVKEMQKSKSTSSLQHYGEGESGSEGTSFSRGMSGNSSAAMSASASKDEPSASGSATTGSKQASKDIQQ
eukprot:TRINITY_DN17985_c0_g5_i1.p1 TRINITY_DN17985_c0_g5~~TRINITY_DN17985_c0_g5_i1.p1  ORF type:complete len:150 (+),score=14.65 TRINITY_DN17985_c0_g5_i1:65-514(+)